MWVHVLHIHFNSDPHTYTYIYHHTPGKEAALKLSQYGYHVIMACRNMDKANVAAADIREMLKAR